MTSDVHIPLVLLRRGVRGEVERGSGTGPE